MIEQIVGLGLERREVAKDFPAAQIGGARVPYPPKDLASIVSLLTPFKPMSYLALEVSSMGGVKFITEKLDIPKVLEITQTNRTKTGLRKFLRTLDEPVDLVSIDGRGIALDAETLWKYLEGGGKSLPEAEFGKGAPPDFGPPKLRPRACLIFNLADNVTRTLWYRMRARYSPMYQSPFTGMCHV